MALSKQEMSAAIDALRNIQSSALTKQGYSAQDEAWLYKYGFAQWAIDILSKTKNQKEREKLAQGKISELAKIKYPNLSKPQAIMAACKSAASSVLAQFEKLSGSEATKFYKSNRSAILAESESLKFNK
jgi:hypothetical protein